MAHHHHQTFIIAEAGVNHNGDINMAKELIKVAAASGADAVKFQTFKTEELCSASAPKANYQRETTNPGESQWEMLKRLELERDAYPELVACCKEYGIEFMSTPFDDESADFLVSLGMKRIKIASGEVTNLPFLRHLSHHSLPLILSTGMADMHEVSEAVAAINASRPLNQGGCLKDYLTILHCTSSYPTNDEDVNLKAMQSIANKFHVPVGYSDHTPGILAAPLAVAMGASVIEKHFTLDRTLPGPDHLASLEPHDLGKMIEHVRIVESMLGDGEKKPTYAELEVRDVARKSLVLANKKGAGEKLREADIRILRPGTGIAPRYLESIIGKSVKTDLHANHVLSWDDLHA